LAALLALAGATSAAASTTIGQLAPGVAPDPLCGGGDFDYLNPSVTVGNDYVVPAGGEVITSWSTNAAAGTGQMLTMKVFRKVAEPTRYTVVAHDGPRALVSATLNTFPVNISVQPGDLIGVNSTSPVQTACTFDLPGGQTFAYRTPGLPDGSEGAFFFQSPGNRVNVTAVVASRPSNVYSFAR
jgi:hypothetical protein